VGARLMDAVDPGLVDQATASVGNCGDVVAVDSMRIRWIGHALHAEVDISVAPETSFREAHHIAHRAEAHLLADVRRLRSAQVHVSPQGEHP
jgi:divalent metal cation (Fe/Co/Zn/Cd) transporter